MAKTLKAMGKEKEQMRKAQTQKLS